MKRSPIAKTSIILFSLLLFVSSLSLLTFSQTTTTSVSQTIVYTTPQSISNHVYYLSLTIKGEIVTNKTSIRSNITSIFSNISALGLPPLPLNGFPLTPPQAIGDNIYFIYVPGVTSISNLSSLILNKYNSTYLAYANYTNGSWHVKNLVTSGIVTGISVYNDSLYALWKQSPTGEAHLLVISQNRVVRNVSVNVPNASSIEVGNGVGVVSNVSPLSFNLQTLYSSEINVEFFVINLTTGKVIYKIPDYKGLSPVQVSVSNNLGLVSYIPMPLISTSSSSSSGYSSSSSMTSYIVLYNLSTGNMTSEKSFNGIALGYINDKFILVYYSPTSETGAVEIFTVYNLSWGQLYQTAEPITPQSFYFPDGLFVNSTAVTILLTQYSELINTQATQVTLTSSLKFINALQAPQPFTINVSEQHYPGYTTLNISWNESQASTYMVYVNNHQVGPTKSESIQYNVTENGTYLIKVIAENPLGEVQENMTVNVTVYPVQVTSTTTSSTTTTTSSSSTTTTTTSTTTTTTTSSTTTTSMAVTTSSSTVSPLTTSSSTTTSQSATTFSTTLVIAIVLIVVAVVALAVFFLARRK